MNTFDKVCAALTFVLGLVLLVGLFTGSKASFSLPPILGAVPALVGWGILKSIVVAWNPGKRSSMEQVQGESGFRPPAE